MNDESDILSKHRSVGRSVVDISSIKERRKVSYDGREEGESRKDEERREGQPPPQHTQVCNISRFPFQFALMANNSI